MNALDTRIDGGSPAAPRAVAHAPHPTHTFKLLLKREFWEHKGGFLWAPLVAGGISLLLTAFGALGAALLPLLRNRGRGFLATFGPLGLALLTRLLTLLALLVALLIALRLALVTLLDRRSAAIV